MKRNIGDADRTFRLLVGATTGFLVSSRKLTGTTAIVVGVLSIWVLLTVVPGWSPLYALFRFSTTRPTDAEAPKT